MYVCLTYIKGKMITRKVTATGSGFHILLPRAVLEDRGIEAGDYVTIDFVKIIKSYAVAPTRDPMEIGIQDMQVRQ